MSSHRLFNTSFPEPLQAINASLESHGDWSGNLLHHDRNGRVLNVLSHWVLNKQDTTAPGTVVEVSVPASGSQPYLTSIIESSNDAVIGETLDAIVISWNPSAERLFEYTAAEMIGKSVAMLFPPDSTDEEGKLISKIRNGETVSHYETVRVSKSGKQLIISLTLSPIYDFAGHLIGISKIARDITEQRLSQDALRRANASLEEFAYAAAHDLQEPLRNISLSLQQLTLENSDLSEEESRETMAVAVRNSNRMQRLIQDLLSFTRALDSEPLVARVSSADANTVVSHAIENLRQSIVENEASIMVESPLPHVQIHPAHLLQLMQNLIGNALKYRKPDVAPLIEIGARVESSRVVICVADNGIGIAPQFHQRVFGVFKRLNHSQQGNGIGLAVCKRIIEHYSGTIWIESTEGAGATFCFSIPCFRKPVSCL
jgi:PAS domain S-box-containing protein